MIVLSRLNGQAIAINPDLITRIEVTPDTTISLLNGERIIVREGLDDVIARVVAFRHAIRASVEASDAYPPSPAVLEGASWGRDEEHRPTPGLRAGSEPPRRHG